MIIAYWLEFPSNHEPNSIARLRDYPKLKIQPINDEISMLFKTHIAFALDNSTEPQTIVCGILNLNKFRFYGYASTLPKLVIHNGDIVQTIDRKVVMADPKYTPELPQLQPYQEAILKAFK